MSEINSKSVNIARIISLPSDGLAELVAESERAGLLFVRRLVDEWRSGVNCFDRPGEDFFAAQLGTDTVGVCGLNIDPYTAQPRVGRVRRLYVLAGHRRLGIGARLVGAVIAAAYDSFDQLRLRTNNPQAALFYERLGFHRSTADENVTHELDLLSARPKNTAVQA